MEFPATATDCFEQIYERIMSLQYKPGTRLSIGTLAQELSIDPTYVREGLARLIETGLVETVDNVGFRVCPFSEEEMSDLFQTYCQVESLALKQAIDFGDGVWEERVRAALSQLAHVEINSQLSKDNYWLWSQRHWAFHYALISDCRSSHLIRIRNQLFRRFEHYIHLAFGDKGEPLAFHSGA
ncbi:MAG: GntR family transcriptional regulator, partial [Parachlamydia sp.]|nr:GntR family transcriptional regulator [Parachlamydia sp.]